MGMFDQLIVTNKWLPDDLKDHNTGWQTKSIENQLKEFVIVQDGSLLECITDFEGEEYKPYDYTGEIYFYNGVGKMWRELKAWCVKGVVKEVIDLTKPKLN